MKKTLFSLLTVMATILALAFALVSCGGSDSCTHEDKNGDGICDKCTEELDSIGDENDPGEDPGSGHTHAYTEKNTNSKYLSSAATCTSVAKYYYSCSCGEKGENTFSHGEALTSHKNENGKCTICELPVSSEGLSFVLNSDRKSYTLAGIGTCTDTDIVVGSYNNLSVVGIKGSDFYNNTTITGVTIGNSVTFIENPAFEGCTNLKYNEYDNAYYLGNETNPYLFLIKAKSEDIVSCSVHENTRFIQLKAFESCANLAGITVSEKNAVYKSINGSLYSKDGKTLFKFIVQKGETQLVIPDSVTSIGKYAFYGCAGLTSVTIPDSVTSISQYAFCGCKDLTDVDISNSVTSIESGAFKNCTSLTSVIIPDSVKDIESGAFYDCYGLTSVTIGSSVTHIGVNAFSNCYKLVEVINKSNLKIDDGNNGWLGHYAKEVHSGKSKIYKNNDGYLFYTYDDVNYLLGYAGSDKMLTLPESYNGESYEIYTRAFYKNADILGVTMPDGVTAIGSAAFYNCPNLTVATIGNQVTTIGGEAFYDCGRLASVTLGNSVNSIDSLAFGCCYRLVEVINLSGFLLTLGTYDYGCVGCYAIEEHAGETKLKNINDYLFYTYDGVNYLVGYLGSDTVLTLPLSYNGESYEIYTRAFYKNADILGVTMPDGVTAIGSAAFYNCVELTSVVIGDRVTNIGNSAFSDCIKLTSVVIGDRVTNIGNSAFSDCIKLTNVVIGNDVTNIGVNAFNDCENLNFNEHDNAYYLGNESNPYMVLVKAKSTDIVACTIHEDTKIIAPDAFADSATLNSVIIPDDVTSIGGQAFSRCTSLKSVTIPNSVTSIGGWAFSMCTSLENINYHGTEDEWGDISKGTNWNLNIDNCTITFNYDGE